MPHAQHDLKISDQRAYQLKVMGHLDEEFIRSMCPAGLTISQDGEIFTLSSIYTDQSGILGLIRGLHNLGCIIIEFSIV